MFKYIVNNDIYMWENFVTYHICVYTFHQKKLFKNAAHLKQFNAILKFGFHRYTFGALLLAVYGVRLSLTL